jgi:hypothetical protein
MFRPHEAAVIRLYVSKNLKIKLHISSYIYIIIKSVVEISHLHKVCKLYVRAFYDKYGPKMGA